MRILAINPGSTSTKIAIFEDLKETFSKTLKHDAEIIGRFPKIIDQFEFRKNIIIEWLKEKNISIDSFDVIVGRGGLVKPIPGGVYKVNQAMIDDLRKEVLGEHASNLGAIIANEISKAASKKIDSFIVDPVVVDELEPLARYSGHPDIPRISIFHALNHKAVARRYARDIGKKYKELKLIVAHLGGGITVGVHRFGKVIDVNNGLDGDGPFSPERAGGLPSGGLAKLCFSGKYLYHEVRKQITGRGGLVAYLGTNDASQIENKIKEGNENARLILDAMAYQIAKEICACAAVLEGKIDAVLITGGLAHSEYITQKIKERVQFLGEFHVYPGEDEMKALAEGVYFAMKGEIEIKSYI